MNFITLDLSSTVCGYSIYINNQLDKISFLKFKSEDMVDKGIELLQFFNETFSYYKIQDISFQAMVIESNLKSFKSGFSNGDSMFKTGQMNFLGRFLCKNNFNLNIVELNVISVRNSWKPGFTKIARAISGKKDKEIVFELAVPELEEKNITLPTKVLKSGPNKGKTVYLDEAYDMVDSYILGEGFINNDCQAILTTKEKVKIKKELKKEKK